MSLGFAWSCFERDLANIYYENDTIDYTHQLIFRQFEIK